MSMSTVTLNDLKSRAKGLVKKILNYPPAPTSAPVQPQATAAPPVLLGGSLRQTVADYYLRGSGIEVGALHNPLQVPAWVEVKYVDRMSVEDLKKHYPELSELNLVEVDILDDGEHLKTIPTESQDFVIANHFIEHCQDPIRAIENGLRVLKSGGILYLGVPDKRHTFDKDRPLTTLEHLLKDYHEGPAWSRKYHFLDYTKYAWLCYKSEDEGQDDPRIEAEALRFMEMDYSIHFHVWTQAEILELLAALKKQLNFGFEVELFLKNQEEMILVLRKD